MPCVNTLPKANDSPSKTNVYIQLVIYFNRYCVFSLVNVNTRNMGPNSSEDSFSHF